MVTSTAENTSLYHIISFFVTWIDYIARLYLHIKANFDAVLYIANQTPIRYQHHSRRHHHQQRKHSIHNSSESIHERRKSAIPIQNLPTEVLQLVLLNGTKNDLFHCTMVCQRWHRLVTPLLWKDPSLPLSSAPTVGNTHTLSSPRSHDTTLSSTHCSCQNHHHHHHSQLAPSSTLLSSFLSRDGKDLSRFIRSLRLPKYGLAIQTLRLGSISQELTDDLLLYITRMCPNLKVLDLSHCQLVTSLGYQHLARSQCASSLTQLNLTSGIHLTDASLVSLSMKCDSLETIHLAGCHRITQTGVRSLVAASRQTLQYINIKDCIKVSGRILQDLAILCGPRLLGVDATRICSILHSDIEILVQHCQYLEQLYIGQNKSALLCELLHRIRKEQQQEPWVVPSSSTHTNKNKTISTNQTPAPRPSSRSISASLLQQRQLSRSKSSYPSSTKPNALDSLLDMLRRHNMSPIEATNTPTTANDHHRPQQSHHRHRRSHRPRHLSQPLWEYNNGSTTASAAITTATTNHRSPNGNQRLIRHQQHGSSPSLQQTTDQQVSYATVEMIMKHLKHLKAVDFSHWNCLTDQLIRRLRQHHGHAIQFIGLEGCRLVTQTSSSLVSGLCDS